jgi:hypothetical protein
MLKFIWVGLLLLGNLFAQYNPDTDHFELRIFKVAYEIPVEEVLNEGDDLFIIAVYDTVNPVYISPYPSFLYKTVEIENDSLLWNEYDEIYLTSIIDYPSGFYEITMHIIHIWEDSSLYGNSTNAAYIEVDSSSVTSIQDPEVFGITLDQNFPNPFNNTTTIKYTIKNPSVVSLSIVEITGRVSHIFLDNVRHPGTHSVPIDASGLASGNYIYFLRVKDNGRTFVLKKVFSVIK